VSVRVDAFLADSVAEQGGRISALGGGFTGLQVPQVPAVLGRLGLAVFVYLAEGREAAKHVVEVRLEDPQGRVLALDGNTSVTGEVDLPALPEEVPTEERVVGMALNVDGLVFEATGLYRFVISVDGEEQRRVPLGVAVLGGS
jgi:hypothetical protein